MAGMVIALAFCAPAPAQQRAQKAQSGSLKLSGVIHFRLEADSIYPSALTVPEGRYLIRLFNHAVPGSVTIQLEDSNEARLADKAAQKGSTRVSGVQDLVAAAYTILSPYDAANPAKEYIRLGGRVIAIENAQQ